jgi:hypothetical protein
LGAVGVRVVANLSARWPPSMTTAATVLTISTGAPRTSAVPDASRVVDISGGSVELGNLTPDREAVSHFGSPSSRAEQMPSGPKMCGDATEGKA